ncbi:MAG: lytic transglycosylase domain-containing protein [Caldilineae bacterium]|nr:lytic transglycosylase domain-containing protein [Caldilineae bacterium]
MNRTGMAAGARRQGTVGAPSRPAAPGGAGRMALVLLLLAAAGRLALGLADPSAPETVLAAGLGPGLGEPGLAFVTYARGRSLEAAELRAAPGAGETLARVPAEAELAIGGSVRYRSGLAPAEALWVLAPTEDGSPRYGFLPADAVRLTAGQPRPLRLDGIPRQALLAPIEGASAVGNAADGPLAAAELELASLPAEASQSLAASSLPEQDLGIAWLPATVSRWSGLLDEAATRHAVDPQLLAIVMLVESGGDPGAGSPAGALGLMQVMPSTAAGIAAARGLDWSGADALYDPETAIDFGAWYLAQQLASFGSAADPDWQRSVELAATAYNGGPGSVTRHLAGGALPAESARYRDWVGGMWRERSLPESPTFAAWWAAGGQRLVEAAATR